MERFRNVATDLHNHWSHFPRGPICKVHHAQAPCGEGFGSDHLQLLEPLPQSALRGGRACGELMRQTDLLNTPAHLSLGMLRR
jgi:hypothetical protein